MTDDTLNIDEIRMEATDHLRTMQERDYAPHIWAVWLLGLTDECERLGAVLREIDGLGQGRATADELYATFHKAIGAARAALASSQTNSAYVATAVPMTGEVRDGTR